MVLPLTLIASIFGMNTTDGMPLIKNDYGFWIILLMMVSVSLVSFIFFKYKKWL
jgi:magnesium transporter